MKNIKNILSIFGLAVKLDLLVLAAISKSMILGPDSSTAQRYWVLLVTGPNTIRSGYPAGPNNMQV
jgi:hypothetical protein